MTDREKFQKTFSKLHASPDLLTEVVEMAEEKQVITKKRRYHIPKAAVAAIACVVVLGSGTAAYAMNVGGIQRTIQIWIHGDQTDAQFVVEDGSYTLDYEDENGEAVHRGGGGVAIEDDGIERPATEEELMEVINMPEAEYEEDGSVWVYYRNQKMDITDKFEDGVCYVELKDGDTIQYMTVKYQNGYALSSERYLTPGEFN